MCGITGWLLNSPPSGAVAELHHMLRSIDHRGPDDKGTHFEHETGVALGHNRLSIIDLSSGGHQPMVNTANGDVLIFNGEIYNFQELRRVLEAKGFKFRTKSDTEVLLFAFAAWGQDCVSFIRGMFAFAVWQA